MYKWYVIEHVDRCLSEKMIFDYSMIFNNSLCIINFTLCWKSLNVRQNIDIN